MSKFLKRIDLRFTKFRKSVILDNVTGTVKTPAELIREGLATGDITEDDQVFNGSLDNSEGRFDPLGYYDPKGWATWVPRWMDPMVFIPIYGRDACVSKGHPVVMASRGEPKIRLFEVSEVAKEMGAGFGSFAPDFKVTLRWVDTETWLPQQREFAVEGHREASRLDYLRFAGMVSRISQVRGQSYDWRHRLGMAKVEGHHVALKYDVPVEVFEGDPFLSGGDGLVHGNVVKRSLSVSTKKARVVVLDTRIDHGYVVDASSGDLVGEIDRLSRAAFHSADGKELKKLVSLAEQEFKVG